LNATSLRAKYEVREREPIWLHPADAAARGIKNGDIVRIFNDRGQTLAGAVVTERVRTGVVLLQEGAWYDPLVPGKIGTLDKHGSANNLTTDAPDSKLADGNQSNTALVQVERYAGPAPAITAFAAPPIQS
jgi:trimethylamine-N-oxide reductase (cytochrome c)